MSSQDPHDPRPLEPARADDADSQELHRIEEEFLYSLRAGVRPSISTLVARHPRLAPHLQVRLVNALQLFEAHHASSSAQETESLEIGLPEHIGRFQILSQLGFGAASIVLRGFDSVLRRPVAIKLSRSALPSDTVTVERFRREAEVVASLRHAHIVPVYDSGLLDTRPYLVMELIEGRTLDDELRRHGDEPMDCRRVAKIASQVADALHFAHVRGVVHRDVKPGNILLDANGEPQLTDFGLASTPARMPALNQATAPGATATDDAIDLSLTLTRDLLGTPRYMSPEQVRRSPEEVDARSDVFSLGVVLYRMLTGRTPFSGQGQELFAQIQTKTPLRPSAVAGAVPPALDAICLKCLEKDREARYQTAQDVGDELRRWLEDLPLRQTHTPWHDRTARWLQRNRRLAAIFLAFAILFVISAGAVWQSYHRGRERSVAAAAREEATMRSLLSDGKIWLQSGAAGRTVVVREEIIPKLRERRQGLLPDAPGEQLDVETRSLFAASLAELDLQEICRVNLLRSVAPSHAWPVALHPSGSELAIGANTRPYHSLMSDEFQLPDVATNVEPQSRLVYSSRGSWLVFVPTNGNPELWSARDFHRVARWPRNEPLSVLAAGFDSSESSLHLCCADGTARSSAIRDGALVEAAVRTLADWPENPSVAAFSQDSQLLAVGDQSGRVMVYAAAGTLQKLQLDSHAVQALAWSPDNAQLAIGTKGGLVRVYDLRLGQTLYLLHVSYNGVDGLCWSPDGRWIAAGEHLGQGSVWESQTGHREVSLPSAVPQGFSADSSLLVGASRERAYVWKLNVPHGVRRFRGHIASVEETAWSADSTHFASLDNRFVVRVWNVATGRTVMQRQLPSGDNHAHNSGLALDDHGEFLAMAFTVNQTGCFQILHLATGEVSEWTMPPGYDRIAFIGNGWFRSVREELVPEGSDAEHQTVVREFRAGDSPRDLGVLRSSRVGERKFFQNVLAQDGSRYLWTGPREPKGAVRLELWDISLGQRAWPPENSPDECYSLRPSVYLTPDGSHLWFPDSIIDVSQPQAFTDTRGALQPNAVAPNHEHRIDIVTSKDSKAWSIMRLLDRSDHVWALFENPDHSQAPAGSIRFSPDSRYVVWGSSDGLITLVDVPAMQEGMVAACIDRQSVEE